MISSRTLVRISKRKQKNLRKSSLERMCLRFRLSASKTAFTSSKSTTSGKSAAMISQLLRVDKYNRNIEWCTEKFARRPQLSIVKDQPKPEEASVEEDIDANLVVLKTTDYHVLKYDEVLETTKRKSKEIVLRDNFTRSENSLFSFVKIN